jgi:putative addiction module CopG family antidote
MSNYQVELSDHFGQFIEAQVASGIYKDPADAVRAGLSLLERQSAEDRRRAKLKELVDESVRQLDAGEGIGINGPEELREFIRSIGDEARARRGCK